MMNKLREWMPGLLYGGLAGLVIGGVFGVGLGIYLLPILTANEGLTVDEVVAITQRAERRGEFRADLEGSDFLHWGRGTIALSVEDDRRFFSLDGEVSPGPDYRLYLTPEYVETERAFLAIKEQSAEVGPIKTFVNFHIEVPSAIDTDGYPAVLIWCETFGQFITAARLN